MSEQAGIWEQIAAFEGGTVNALASAVASDGAVRNFAATPVGVFWSEDGGACWQPLGSGSAVAGAEVVVPSPGYVEDGTVFVGGHGGLYRWQAARPGWDHLLNGSRVLALAVIPPAPDNAERGGAPGLTIMAGTEDDGILLSRDGGRTWTGANPGLLDLTVLALAASPDFHEDGLAYAATPSGLYRTRNGAESWRALDVDDDEVAVQCLAVSPEFADDRVVLAGSEEHGLLRSDDAGRSWDVVADLDDLSVNAVAFVTPERVVAATDSGVALSEDGGLTWRRLAPGVGPVLGVVAVARTGGDQHDDILLAGLPAGGVVRSEDGGATLAPANAGLTAHLLVGLACSPRFADDRTLYAASLQGGINVSRDGGRTWTDANDGLSDLAVAQVVAVPMLDGGASVFAVTAAGLFVSHDGAATWMPAFRLPDGASVQALAAVAGTVAVATSGGLLLSADGGATWTPRQPPGEARTVALALAPTFERDGTMYAATAGSPRSDGTADVTVWRLRQPAGRWERIFDERTSEAVHLCASTGRDAGDSVLIGLGQRVLRQRANATEVRGGIRRPVWDAIDLPARLAGLAAAPGGVVFAATGGGVYASRDGGSAFEACGGGLEGTGVVHVCPSPAYPADGLVFAVALGGAIWRLGAG